MPTTMHDPEYWLNLAKQARIRATVMTNHEARRELPVIGKAYERLAEHVERTTSRKRRVG
jgi:hypothetical protein